MKIDKKELLSILSLLILALLGIVLFWGKQGHIIVDVGREFLISEQVMNGEVLYKDIFNIYGPLAYQINAILLKLFGNNVMTLYLAGVATAFAIVSSAYILARQFFSYVYASFITIAVIGAGVYCGDIFNYVMPYSYAILYGMLAVTISLIYLIRYVKNQNGDIRDFYISLLLGGAAIAFKYDFAPYVLIFPYVAIWVKKLNKRELFYSVIFAVLVPIVSVSHLISQGLNITDIVFNVDLFKRIAQAPALAYFYKHVGVYPTANRLIEMGSNTLFVIPCTMLIGGLTWYFQSKIKNNISRNCFIGVVFTLASFFAVKSDFADKFTFLPLLIIIFFALNINKFFKVKSNFVFIIATILITLKTLFFFKHNSYGLYYLPFVLISLVLILENYCTKREQMCKFIVCLLLTVYAVSAAVISYQTDKISLIKNKIETEKGWLPSVSGNSATHLIIEKLQMLEPESTIVVLPEGHFLNYLTNHQTDAFYNNFIPMYVEAFGEENIIEHYTKNMPDYFVINDRNSAEYGYQCICDNYAQNLCQWIFKNYHVVYKIVGEPQYILLRKN